MKFLKKVLLALFLIPSLSHAQCFYDKWTPDTVTDQISIKNTVIMEGLTKDQVYDKILRWVAERAPSQEAIVMKDREMGVYKGKAKINYDYKDGFRTVYFSIKLLAYDGYLQYVISDFVMNEKPMEQYVKDKEGDTYYKTAFDDICQKVIAVAETIQ